jgi:hypothetical protein
VSARASPDRHRSLTSGQPVVLALGRHDGRRVGVRLLRTRLVGTVPKVVASDLLIVRVWLLVRPAERATRLGILVLDVGTGLETYCSVGPGSAMRAISRARRNGCRESVEGRLRQNRASVGSAAAMEL